MSELSDAADVLAGWSERLAGIGRVGEALKKLGSLEQAKTERETALAAAVSAHEAAKAELDKINADVATARLARDAEAAAHAARLEGQTKAAQAAADQIRADAQVAASLVKGDASGEAARIREGHAKAMADARTELKAVQKELADATAALTVANAEYATIKDKTDALKKAAQSILA